MSEDTSSSKAPLGAVPETSADATKRDVNGGFSNNAPAPKPLINVQPPRREDLQPSYAQTLVGESDQGNHGWYGSMSMYLCPQRLQII